MAVDRAETSVTEATGAESGRPWTILDQAGKEADLGQAVSQDTRLRWVKVLVLRGLRLIIRRQSDFNHLILRALRDQAEQVQVLHQRLDRIQWRVEGSTGQGDAPVTDLPHALELMTSRMDLIHRQLAEEQRRSLAEVSGQLEQIQDEIRQIQHRHRE